MNYESLIRPLMFRLPAEAAHEFGLTALRLGLAGRYPASYEGYGTIERFGLQFPNPIGVAAGFDKNGVAVNQLAGLGFGFVEVGTVTLEPQPGNPKPRLFRLPQDQALINRLGFNNDGATAVAERLSNLTASCPVGINIGKNRDVPIEEATQNYIKCLQIVQPVADYIVVNVSSPNTAKLRELQEADALGNLLSALVSRNGELGAKPLLVKIAPDLDPGQIEMIVDVCVRQQIVGIIATNTTVSRAGLSTEGVARMGPGGLSGRPLTRRSTEVISAIFSHSKRKLPIIGVGGIFTPEDAFDKIAAGASLLQAYTGFVYGGPSFARAVNLGLSAILRERGFSTLDEAVGSAHPH